MTRSILHVNIDSFSAVVEQRKRPELKGRAVIIATPRGNTSGIVVSCSKEAAKLGVEEGMSVRHAQRSAPNATILRANEAVYRQVSEQFLNILAQYTPLVEPDSLGSAYIDVTASRNLFGDAREISSRITSQLFDIGLHPSIGSAANKLLAKAASRAGKPFTHITPGRENDFLSPLPVNILDLVNAKIEKRLSDLGISTIGQLAQIPESLLIRQFGPIGSLIKRQSLGIDPSQVKASYPSEIIMTEQTFETPIEEPEELKQHLGEIASEAQFLLRKKGTLAGEVTLNLFDESSDLKLQIENCKLKMHPAYFHFKNPTDSATHIRQSLEKLLDSTMQQGMQIFRIQVILSDLTQGESSQLCLMGEGERTGRLGRAVELIRERFGEGSVCVASSLAPSGRARALSRIAA